MSESDQVGARPTVTALPAPSAPSASAVALAVPAADDVPSGYGYDGVVDAVAVPIVRPRPIFSWRWNPYEPASSAQREKIVLRADRGKGGDGQDGASGNNGSSPGTNGWPGENALPATPGENAGRLNLELSYAGTVSLARQRPCRLHAVSTGIDVHRVIQREEILELGDFPDVSVTSIGGDGGRGAKGGTGGNGMNGERGRDATRYSSGKNGGNGGNGGDGGYGSNGGHGGNGGVIHINIPEQDRFLLMAIEDTAHPLPLVRGGKGGTKGAHGRGGRGGMGGKGGHHYRSIDSDGNSRYKSGGHDGSPGHDGGTPPSQLHDGNWGQSGKFSIQLGNRGIYKRRYDLQLASHYLGSLYPMMVPNCFQFGDTAFVQQIEVLNSGGMPSPLEKVVCSILNPRDYIVALNDKKAILPYGSASIAEGQSRKVDGSLEYFITLPQVPSTAGDDFGPIVRRMNLLLRATQLGPEEDESDSCFRRDYQCFDTKGTPICFRHPVENTEGFQGITSVRAGETMKVGLKLSNISLQDIGSRTKNSRKVWVQFYSDADLVLCMNGEQCTNLGKATEDLGSLWRGHLIDVPRIEAKCSTEMEGTLRLSDQIPPYTRIAVQADILLEELDSPLSRADGSSQGRGVSLIQRRKLEVVNEPTCAFRQDCHVVLVTSVATRRVHFTSYKPFIEDGLGFKMDAYSVSLYGSLSPEFMISSERCLSDYFSGKLVIVLDHVFNPLDDDVDEMSPSDMLPNGCMEQTSGFSPSTKWLFVGSRQSSIEELLCAHFTVPANDVTTFVSKSEFQDAMKKRLNNERSLGTLDGLIREDIINLKNKWRPGSSASQYEKEAHKVAAWLQENDPLRQHVVEWYADSEEKGRLVVRRGFCSTVNSAFIVHGQSSEKVKFAIARALPPELGVEAFCHSVSAGDEDLCQMLRNAFTSIFLSETENYREGDFFKGNLSNDILLQNFFHSISSLIYSESMAELIKEKGTESFMQRELSCLVGQLRAVANSKDLRPWWNPLSKKYRIKNSLVDMVCEVEDRWGPALDYDVIEAHTDEIKGSVRAHISETRKKRRIRVHNRWRKGLRWKFSHKGGGTGGTSPLIEMGHYYKHMEKDKNKFSHRPALSKVPGLAECNGFRQRAQQRMDMSKKLQQAIEATRQMAVLDHAEPEVDLTS